MTTDAYLKMCDISYEHTYQVWFDQEIVDSSPDYFRALSRAKDYGAGDSEVNVFRRDLIAADTKEGKDILQKAIDGGKRRDQGERRRGTMGVDIATEIRSIGAPPGVDPTAAAAVASAKTRWEDEHIVQEGERTLGQPVPVFAPHFTVVYTLLGYRKRGAGNAAQSLAREISHRERNVPKAQTGDPTVDEIETEASNPFGGTTHAKDGSRGGSFATPQRVFADTPAAAAWRKKRAQKAASKRWGKR